MKLPRTPSPTKIPLHHVANVLPVGHKRDDYDFDHADGRWGPIRINAQNIPDIYLDLPAMVWCRRHGWEKEIIPAADIFTIDGLNGEKVWGWLCPACGRSRHETRFSKERAERSLAQHVDDKHSGILPYRLRGLPPAEASWQ